MPSARPSRLAIVGAAASFATPIVVATWLASQDGPGPARGPRGAWLRVVDVVPEPWTLPLGVLVGLLGSAAVLLADRHPRPGLVAAALVATLGWVLLFAPVVPTVVAFAVAIVLAVRRGEAAWAAAAVAGFLGSGVLLLALGGGPPSLTVLTVMTAIALATVLVVAGSRRARREQERVAREHADEQARTRHAREREAMARELHDVLAHSLSSISVQANVALHLAGREPERATAALVTIRDASRQALDDVRHMLGVLRGEADGPLVPEASLDALDAIVGATAAMGIRVEVEDALHPRPSTAIQSAIVRIVREALTNAARHAPGATVRVTLTREAGVVRASVADDGPVGTAGTSQGSGAGILGMRERVALLGGTLDAGPRGRGFAVVATFPEPS